MALKPIHLTDGTYQPKTEQIPHYRTQAECNIDLAHSLTFRGILENSQKKPENYHQ